MHIHSQANKQHKLEHIKYIFIFIIIEVYLTSGKDNALKRQKQYTWIGYTHKIIRTKYEENLNKYTHRKHLTNHGIGMVLFFTKLLFFCIWTLGKKSWLTELYYLHITSSKRFHKKTY